MHFGEIYMVLCQRGFGMGKNSYWGPKFYGRVGKKGGKNSNLVILCFAIVAWGLWTTRNKFAIEGAFPSQPTGILFQINVWMQRWRIVLKEGERMILDSKIKAAEDWLKNFMKTCKNNQTSENFM